MTKALLHYIYQKRSYSLNKKDKYLKMTHYILYIAISLPFSERKICSNNKKMFKESKGPPHNEN